MRRVWLCGLMLVLSLVTARAGEPLPVVIGVQTDADWLTIAAQKFQIFEKAGLAPTYIKFAAGAPMMAAAQSGSIDAIPTSRKARASLSATIPASRRWPI